MKTYKYEEKSLIGDWRIEVRKGSIHIGNIRKHPISGVFRYYEGPNNFLNYSFEESDLETLKRRIEK